MKKRFIYIFFSLLVFPEYAVSAEHAVSCNQNSQRNLGDKHTEFEQWQVIQVQL